MQQYVIATTKTWNLENARALQASFPDETFHIITDKDALTPAFLDSIRPRYVFFPHWSWIIPAAVFETYPCVVFHMTDLPFGRGGSPLQNLLVRGIHQTKISALRVNGGIDTGDIYFKEPFDISTGNAGEILARASDVVFRKMIPRFLKEDLQPVPQTGEAVTFRRRTPDESRIPEGLSPAALYDFIRMLDGEGYPAAYADFNGIRVFFHNAALRQDTVTATATFRNPADEASGT